jgi:CRISPR-associated exonuclease Cas4
MDQTIRIADLRAYLHCPRLVYFDAPKPLPQAEHMLLRGLALSLSNEGNLMDSMVQSLERLVEELPFVYPGGFTLEELCMASGAVVEIIPNIAKELLPSLEKLLPCELEVDLRSDKLGFSGRLDRLVDEGKVPSVIRTGSPPETGVWKSDRLQLTGYAMILEDLNKIRIDKGMVEYPRFGMVREFQIRSIDRSRVLRIRDRIKQIKGGRLPDRPKEAMCESCQIQDLCQAHRSLASKFF